MFSAYDIAGSGMAMAKQWMEVTSNNISNINTTRGADGNPYRRQTVILEEKRKFDSFMQDGKVNGVQIQQIAQDSNENIVYNPEHPDAGENGYVRLPQINVAAEVINLMVAQKAYAANASAFNASKEMYKKELEIGRG